MTPVSGNLVFEAVHRARSTTADGPSSVSVRPVVGRNSWGPAVQLVHSNRIVGYSLDSRMTAELAVAALRNAVALREPVGTILRSDRGAQLRSRKFVELLRENGLTGSMGCVGARADNAAMESFFSLLQKNALTRSGGAPTKNSGSRSSPGSNGRITGGAGNADSENSPRSSSRQSTHRPPRRPEAPNKTIQPNRHHSHIHTHCTNSPRTSTQSDLHGRSVRTALPTLIHATTGDVGDRLAVIGGHD